MIKPGQICSNRKFCFVAHGSLFAHLLSFNENICLILASTRLNEFFGWSIIRASFNSGRESSTFRSSATEKGNLEALRSSTLRARKLLRRHVTDVPTTGWSWYLQSSFGTDASRSSLRNRDDYQLFCTDPCAETWNKSCDKHQSHGYNSFCRCTPLSKMVGNCKKCT